MKTTLGILIQPLERKDGYVHLRAYPVQLDTERPGSVRNIGTGSHSSDLIGGLYLGHLVIDSQGNEHDDARHLYGFDVQYGEIYRIDRYTAAAMAKTLTTLDKRLSKLSDTRGYTRSFGEFVGRIAEAIGATTMVRRPKDDERTSFHDHGDWRRYTLGDGVIAIDTIVREWVTERERAREAVAS